jgi:hypothetical protein
MTDPHSPLAAEAPTKAEVAAAVEAIGRLHHMCAGIAGTLAMARITAEKLLQHSHALPGGVPRDAALAFTKLRLEVAHGDMLTLDTLRSIVAAVPVPEVRLSSTASRVVCTQAPSSGTGSRGKA